MNYKYTLSRVLEIAIVIIVFLGISEITFWMMNQASTLLNTLGFLLLLTNVISFLFYAGNYIKRINNKLNS